MYTTPVLSFFAFNGARLSKSITLALALVEASGAATWSSECRMESYRSAMVVRDQASESDFFAAWYVWSGHLEDFGQLQTIKTDEKDCSLKNLAMLLCLLKSRSTYLSKRMTGLGYCQLEAEHEEDSRYAVRPSWQRREETLI